MLSPEEKPQPIIMPPVCVPLKSTTINDVSYKPFSALFPERHVKYNAVLSMLSSLDTLRADVRKISNAGRKGDKGIDLSAPQHLTTFAKYLKLLSELRVCLG